MLLLLLTYGKVPVCAQYKYQRCLGYPVSSFIHSVIVPVKKHKYTDAE